MDVEGVGLREQLWTLVIVVVTLVDAVVDGLCRRKEEVGGPVLRRLYHDRRFVVVAGLEADGADGLMGINAAGDGEAVTVENPKGFFRIPVCRVEDYFRLFCRFCERKRKEKMWRTNKSTAGVGIFMSINLETVVAPHGVH